MAYSHLGMIEVLLLSSIISFPHLAVSKTHAEVKPYLAGVSQFCCMVLFSVTANYCFVKSKSVVPIVKHADHYFYYFRAIYFLSSISFLYQIAKFKPRQMVRLRRIDTNL